MAAAALQRGTVAVTPADTITRITVHGAPPCDKLTSTSSTLTDAGEDNCHYSAQIKVAGVTYSLPPQERRSIGGVAVQSHALTTLTWDLTRRPGVAGDDSKLTSLSLSTEQAKKWTFAYFVRNRTVRPGDGGDANDDDADKDKNNGCGTRVSCPVCQPGGGGGGGDEGIVGFLVGVVVTLVVVVAIRVAATKVRRSRAPLQAARSALHSSGGGGGGGGELDSAIRRLSTFGNVGCGDDIDMVVDGAIR
jgi:hypothetical protein